MSRINETNVSRLIFWYSEIGAPPNWRWTCPVDVNPDGTWTERTGKWRWEFDEPGVPAPP
jgi:hypothetical protein